ncbi:MAG: nucleotidyltransferase family protein, partial [Ruminococcus sp.]|nr:nucleotidyltransferase family protein [Ruminococcus sp.]
MNTDYKILLNIVGFQLFGGEKPKLDGFDIPSVLTEAKKQTVFSLAYPFVRDELKKTFPEQYGKYNEEFYKNIITNTSNHIQHGELHTLMTENSVPYCVLKGYASAYYYPDPSLREMGDVDFLIYEKDFQRAGKLLTGIGFTAGIEDNGEHLHIGYKRDSLSIWEMHRSVNGVPKGKAGEIIKAEIAKAIETSEQVSGDGFICVIP